MRLSVAYDFLPRRLTPCCRRVLEHFGVDPVQGPFLVADVDVPLPAGGVVYFAGPSGSGKSSLLRRAADGLIARGDRVERVDLLRLPRRTLVDALQLPFGEGLELLSACGLGEAQILLRTPRELSDGQRHRFRLALGLARLLREEIASPEPQGAKDEAVASRKTPQGAKDKAAASCRTPRRLRRPVGRSVWLAADEFTGSLDRTLAKVLAFNARRLADRTGVGLLLAGCHEDLLADLDPDVLLRLDLDGRLQVTGYLPQQGAVGPGQTEGSG